jgi:hypothetical protein
MRAYATDQQSSICSPITRPSTICCKFQDTLYSVINLSRFLCTLGVEYFTIHPDIARALHIHAPTIDASVENHLTTFTVIRFPGANGLGAGCVPEPRFPDFRGLALPCTIHPADLASIWQNKTDFTFIDFLFL